jgi:hypothetical protein
MRKLLSVAGAMMIATSVFATPAHAQTPMAGGSCGYQAGDFGLSNVDMDMFPGAGMTVPDLFFQVNYSGVPAPTTIGVIVRFNGELEEQRQVFSATADTSGGTLLGSIRVSTDPEGQGGGTGEMRVQSGISNSRGNRDSDGVGRNGRPSPAVQRNGDNTSGQRGGGIEPGEYVFYVYTGSRGDVYNVKDGTVARNAFIADEKGGFLGTFSCGVSQNGE